MRGHNSPRYILGKESDILAQEGALLRQECLDFPDGSVVGSPSASAGDMGLIPGPGGFHGLWGNQGLCTTMNEPVLESLSTATRESLGTAVKT